MEDFIFSVGDERLLAEKILQFLSLNEKAMIEKRIGAFQYAQSFTKGRRDEAYFSLYDTIISSHGATNEVSKA
jgi:hypothetical protein